MGKKQIIPINSDITVGSFFGSEEDDEDEQIDNNSNAHIDEEQQETGEENETESNLTFIPHINIVSIGDSITAGVGDEEKNGGYVGILEEVMNTETQSVTFYNHGKSGNRTDQLYERLHQKEIIDDITNADTILITIGANDIMKIFSENIFSLELESFVAEENNYQTRLADILSHVRNLNAHASIYLIGFYNPFREYFPDIPELEQIINTWNAIGKEQVSKFHHTFYIPTKDLYEEQMSDHLSEDNFHLNHAGYQLMSERILQHLVENEGELYEQIEFPKD